MISITQLKKILGGILLFLFVFGIFLLLQKGCDYGITKATEPKMVQTETTVIPGDIKPVTSKEYTPGHEKPIYIKVTVPVDTAAIIAAYYSKMAYVDTLRNDSSLLVVVSDSVTQNRIAKRQFTIQNRKPTAILNTNILTVQKPTRIQVFAGVFGGYMVKQKQPQFGINATLLFDGSVQAGYGYDFINNGHLAMINLKLMGKRK